MNVQIVEVRDILNLQEGRMSKTAVLSNGISMVAVDVSDELANTIVHLGLESQEVTRDQVDEYVRQATTVSPELPPTQYVDGPPPRPPLDRASPQQVQEALLRSARSVAAHGSTEHDYLPAELPSEAQISMFGDEGMAPGEEYADPESGVGSI